MKTEIGKEWGLAYSGSPSSGEPRQKNSGQEPEAGTEADTMEEP